MDKTLTLKVLQECLWFHDLYTYLRSAMCSS